MMVILVILGVLDVGYSGYLSVLDDGYSGYFERT
jgi:hypothetical protein